MLRRLCIATLLGISSASKAFRNANHLTFSAITSLSPLKDRIACVRVM